MKRTTVPSPALWGWPETDTVEAVRLTQRGATYSVDKVYLNDVMVGFVVGRPEGRTGKMWDYVAGDHHSPTPNAGDFHRYVFGKPSRQHALAALVENHKARVARKAGA